MKTSLLFLSGLTMITLSSNHLTKNFNLSNINNNTKLTIKNNQTTLFNNQYHYLNNDDWITNQSTIDHKFYSYDTSALVAYSFSNARDTFLVDNSGNLVYNPQVTIPAAEKVNIENTKQEMNTHKKVTTIINNDQYGESLYWGQNYFAGDNKKWQYLKFGGLEKDIDISKQLGGNKVTNSNNLSEPLVLYYIAKASKNGLIDNAIANELGKYFLKQSSLNQQISSDLIIKIIDLIINNKMIYDFITNTPITVNDKNYCINYIFDANNNLVQISYQQISANNMTIAGVTESPTISTDYDDDTGGFVMSVEFYRWTSFAKNWNQFVQLYPKFSFGIGSKMTVTAYEYGKETNSTNIDNKIRNTIDIADVGDNTNNTTFDCEVTADDGLDLTLHLTLYHDDTSLNVALSYSSQWPQFDIDEGGSDFVDTNFNITSFYFSK